MRSGESYRDDKLTKRTVLIVPEVYVFAQREEARSCGLRNSYFGKKVGKLVVRRLVQSSGNLLVHELT